MEQGEWTEADVERILSNPIYVGMGSYPQIIAEDVERVWKFSCNALLLN